MAVRNVAMREAIRRALREEMLRDESVFVMGEGSRLLARHAPDHARFFGRIWRAARS